MQLLKHFNKFYTGRGGKMIDQLQQSHSVMVAAHRGWKSKYPENTLLAFRKALEYGVQMLEFDLRLTKDKVVVVIHDQTVDRTTNGTGKVQDFTLEEIKKLDAGQGEEIPTLKELCELITQFPNVLLNVEIKPNEHAIEVADQGIALLTQYDLLSQCVFTSFDANVVAHIHDHHHLKTQGFPSEKMYNYVPGDQGTYSKLWAIGISMDLLTPEAVANTISDGKLAWCYCPDNDEQVKYALDCGVTLMTCNDIEPAMKTVAAINNESR